jgi:CRISPR system Cascade subunit CasE
MPEPRALALWSARFGLTSPDGDYGYALHALLRTAFGDAAPKPFRYLSPHRGLLAYTHIDRNSLHGHAALAAPNIARALGLNTLDARPFPSTWRPKQRLGFEVRIRPVIRTTEGRERDAYLHAVEPLPRRSEASVQTDDHPERETVYRTWLARQMGADSAAHLLGTTMDAFRLTRVLRRAAANEQGKRKHRTPAGPDVVFKGELEIGDPDAFTRLVARGIGRHRAFGYGMLLLKPPNSC